MRTHLVRVAAAAAFLSASLVLAQTAREPDATSESPEATRGMSNPKRSDSRRSRVWGAPMDPGSGTQGVGSEQGPGADNGGLTGSEGQDDSDTDENSYPQP